MAENATKRLQATHGVICSMPREPFGYFGWPTVARLDDGTLIAGASGPRATHVCPWGKTSLFFSRDDGKTWTFPNIVNNTPIDDRDVGLISLGGSKLLMSWFTRDVRIARYRDFWPEHDIVTKEQRDAVYDLWTEESVARWVGSWIRLSGDGGEYWGDFIKAPVSTPHGPIRLNNGDLLYLGKADSWTASHAGPLLAVRSTDGGTHWTTVGAVPPGDGTSHHNFGEPHVVELRSGKLIGMIRYGQDPKHPDPRFGNMTMFQTESVDGGQTWSPPWPVIRHGGPPHLLSHSSGVLICTYGYREAPFGQRVMLSTDEGKTWVTDYILRDDGPDRDLGYPSSVEMPDGSIFSVYYQKVADSTEKCSLLWSRWELPV